MKARAKLEAANAALKSGGATDSDKAEAMALLGDQTFLKALAAEGAAPPPAEPAEDPAPPPAMDKALVGERQCAGCQATISVVSKHCPECGASMSKALVPAATPVEPPPAGTLAKALAEAAGDETADGLYDVFPVFKSLAEIQDRQAVALEASTAVQQRILKSLHMLHARLDEVESLQKGHVPATAAPDPQSQLILHALTNLQAAATQAAGTPAMTHPAMGKGMGAPPPATLQKGDAIRVLQKSLTTGSLSENDFCKATRQLDYEDDFAAVVQRYDPKGYAELTSAGR